MKQRIVVRVSNNIKKYQSKAMQITVALQGVETVALQGVNKDQIMVIGEGVDAVRLTSLLRKKLGFAELVTVVPIDETGTVSTKETMMQQSVFGPCNQASIYTTCQPSLLSYHHLQEDDTMRNQDQCMVM